MALRTCWAVAMSRGQHAATVTAAMRGVGATSWGRTLVTATRPTHLAADTRRRRTPSSTDKGFSITDVAGSSSGEEVEAGAKAPRAAASAAVGGGGAGAPTHARSSTTASSGGGRGDDRRRGGGSGGGGGGRPRTPPAAAPGTPSPSPPRTEPSQLDAAGARMMAYVDGSGVIVPLQEEKAAAVGAAAPAPVGMPADPAATRAAVKQLAYERRLLRATYDSSDVDEVVAALQHRHGDDVELTDLEELTREGVDHDPDTDPLRGVLPFNLKAVEFNSVLTLTAAHGENPRDRRVRLTCTVSKLGLTQEVAQYVRAIAGPHYHADDDVLRISCDSHAEAGQNRRQVLEQLVQLVVEAGRLNAKHGAMKEVPQCPAYVD